MKNSSEKFIYQFLESIRIEYGKVLLLSLHQRRVDQTFRYFFPNVKPIQLGKIIDTSSCRHLPIVKCRITYSATKTEVKFIPYDQKSIHRIVSIDSSISYPFKFQDRSEWQELSKKVKQDEEVLITTKGRIRETSYTNVLLFKDGEWLTPQYPIFYGVMRTYVLTHGLAKEADLYLDDLNRCEKIKLINAMMPFDSCITLSL